MYYVSQEWITGRWYIGIIGTDTIVRYYRTQQAAVNDAVKNGWNLIAR